MTSLPTPQQASRPHGSPVVARTVALHDPGTLLGLLPDRVDPTELFSWVRRGEGLVGWGRALEFTAHGPDRFERAEAWWRDVVDGAVVRNEVSLPGTGPVAFGSISYAADSPAGATLVVPEVVVGARDGQLVGHHHRHGRRAAHAGRAAAVASRASPPGVRVRRRRARPRRVGRGRRARGATGSPAAASTRWSWRATCGSAPRRRSTRAGCSPGWPSATTRPGSSPSTASWGRPPRCSCGSRRAWSPPGCSPGRSAAPGTTSTTSRWPPRWPGRARTSRSTSTPSGPSPTPCARTARRSTCPRRRSSCTCPTSCTWPPTSPACWPTDATSLSLAASLHPSAAVCGTPSAVADELITELEEHGPRPLRRAGGLDGRQR